MEISPPDFEKGHQNIRAGDDVRTALLKAGPRRLCPILMTSAAMALVMLPTAMGKGVGAEFRSPMAISVIGGVIISTFLTLLVVPVVFTAVEKIRPTALFKRRPAALAIKHEVFTPEAEKAA